MCLCVLVVFLGAVFILVGFLTLYAWLKLKRIKQSHHGENTPLIYETVRCCVYSCKNFDTIFG